MTLTFCSPVTLRLTFSKRKLSSANMCRRAKFLPKIFVDSDGYWAAMYSMPKIIGYNTRMVKRPEVPRTDEELLNPKWKGKIATDHTKPEPFFWIMQRMGHEKGIAYLKRLAAQEMRFYAGLSLLTSLLAAGEFPIGLYTYLHSVEEARVKAHRWNGWHRTKCSRNSNRFP